MLAGIFSSYADELKGRVNDSKTNESLVGVNIIIKGTTKGTVTDVNGNYTLNNVPQESVILFSFLGYQTKEVAYTGQDEINVQLESGSLELGDVIVTIQAQGQRKAINDQVGSVTVSNMISGEQMKEVPDANAAESIGRIAGVSIKRSSGEGDQVVVRGMQPNLNLVTVNGVRMPSTDQNNNAVGLAGISQYMLDGIEVRKSLTAQDDADVVGAIVDLKLATAPEDLKINAIVENMYNGLTNSFNSYRASLQGSNRFFNNKLGVIAQINAESVDRSRERLSASYGRDNRESSNEGVYLQSGGVQLHEIRRERYSANVIADYRLPQGKIQFNTIYNLFNEDRWEKNYNVAVGTQPGITKQQNSIISNNSTFVSSLRLETKVFNFADFDFGASFTNGLRNDPGNNRLTFHYNKSGESPISDKFLENTYGKTAYEIIPNINEQPASYLIDALSQEDVEFQQQEITLQTNLKLPFKISDGFSGKVKIGGKMRFKDRSYDSNLLGGIVTGGDAKIVINAFADAMPEYSWLPRQYNDLVNASPLYERGWEQSILDDRVLLKDFASRSNVDHMLNTMVDRRFEDVGIFLTNPESSASDYNGSERLTAAYFMTDLNIGRKLSINAGLRYEEERTTYSGHGVKQELDRKLTQVKQLGPNERVNQFLLPSVNVKFQYLKWADIRLAYSQSLARPGYYSFIPRYYRDFRRSMINPAGNMNLDPSRSENLDLILSFYNKYIGLFTIGGFYKEISDFYYVRNFKVIDEEADNLVHGYEDLTISKGQSVMVWFNSPEPSSIRGAEFDLQTSFWYLPKPFNGLVLNANFSLMESKSQYYESRLEKEYYGTRPWEFKDVRVDTILTRRLIDQPDFTMNVSLGYDYKGFSVRLAYNYQGDAMAWKGNRPEDDGYTHSYQRWDLSLNQKLPVKGLSMQLLVNNLTGITDKQYQYARKFITYEEFYGASGSLGIRYSF